ncbi:DNA mismatch repair protein [Wickerhamomyces ciferrii]|uniref:DNA mismatch repair protein HSM3 n=1 Tax=Wickerhamomyces ciferrii (strain ATCC 14091 / BCRC 22168 / CBS 111 / JCM 3599 / NBRC 0793 / NRRL Y-1031 F-60-10) TaxID=1206466 RepID=K0KCM9_WICCF|nr:DNA mismatch repair protein [Wickerhamomyces ciferrii]CCH40651.1 DNA mismatch repair protein [Wickerhamomyces ciferrii]
MSSDRNIELQTRLQEHLLKVNVSEVDDLDTKLIDDFISIATIDKTIHHDQNQIKDLLLAIIDILHNNSLDIDYNKVIGLLDAVLIGLDFETVIDLFKLDLIVEALHSPNENLQILAMKVSAKASPPDILSNTEIIPKAVELLSIKDSSIKLVNEIEKSIGTLVSGELIRRRLLSGNVESKLLGIKESNDTTVKSRLLDLLIHVLPLVKEQEINPILYKFTKFTEDNDILYTLNLIRFYTEILDIVDSSLEKYWLLVNIEDQINIIGKLYAERSTNSDIEYFAVTELSLFFKKLSLISPSLFETLDNKFVKIGKNDHFLLATLNASYLGSKHQSILKQLPLNINNISIFRNLISDPTSFNSVKDEITTNKLLKLPYVELFAILSKLAQYNYSAKLLLQELPQVMNKVIEGRNVSEPESYELRKLTIENLLQQSDEDLEIWKSPLQREYYTITHGHPLQSQALVQDTQL